jgi:hypothetical protein
VFLVASLLSVGFLYGCVSVVHQFLGGTLARRVRRGAKYAAIVYAALLIAGWSAYHFNADPVPFTRLRTVLRIVAFPLTLGAWVWLMKGAERLTDAAWRAKVRQLARHYLVLFSVILVIALVRDRLEAAGPAIPLVIDVFLVLGYTLLSVLWVESVQEPRRAPAAARLPPPE